MHEAIHPGCLCLGTNALFLQLRCHASVEAAGRVTHFSESAYSRRLRWCPWGQWTPQRRPRPRRWWPPPGETLRETKGHVLLQWHIGKTTRATTYQQTHQKQQCTDTNREIQKTDIEENTQTVDKSWKGIAAVKTCICTSAKLTVLLRQAVWIRHKTCNNSPFGRLKSFSFTEGLTIIFSECLSGDRWVVFQYVRFRCCLSNEGRSILSLLITTSLPSAQSYTTVLFSHQ